jgi:hypothetical protein
MSRRRPRARRAAAYLITAALGVGFGGAAAASPGPKPPTRVMVRAQEFDLLLSRLKVDPGSAVVQYYNDGEDPHDLRIQRLGDPEVVPMPELPPGELAEVGLELRRKSRYVMWCSLANHRELGMDATLRVRRKRK